MALLAAAPDQAGPAEDVEVAGDKLATANLAHDAIGPATFLARAETHARAARPGPDVLRWSVR